MIRLFVGLALPEDIRLRLAVLCCGLPGARWVRPESLHLTLRFIGEVDEARLEDIDLALSRIEAPPLEIALERIDIFGKDSAPHMLWAGVERNPCLGQLQAKVDRALVTVGLPPEGRKFTPHVTLARFKAKPRARLTAFMAEHAYFRAGPIRIEQFFLFSSFLSRSGAIYRPEASYSLGA